MRGFFATGSARPPDEAGGEDDVDLKPQGKIDMTEQAMQKNKAAPK
jgi:hypothetical protein